MAQLPDDNKINNDSLMDDIKVIQNDETFNDTDSLKNHVDEMEFDQQQMEDIQHHSQIQDRDNAPEPPNTLTLQSLQQFNDDNPQTSMLAHSQISGVANSSHTGPGIEGINDLLGGFGGGGGQAIPDLLIDPLVDMGFSRYN